MNLKILSIKFKGNTGHITLANGATHQLSLDVIDRMDIRRMDTVEIDSVSGTISRVVLEERPPSSQSLREDRLDRIVSRIRMEYFEYMSKYTSSDLVSFTASNDEANPDIDFKILKENKKKCQPEFTKELYETEYEALCELYPKTGEEY